MNLIFNPTWFEQSILDSNAAITPAGSYSMTTTIAAVTVNNFFGHVMISVAP